MENLDLNSQQEDFPYIEEYSALLDRGRGRADGGRAASFQPPRQSASGIPIGRGRSAGRGSGRARGRSVSASHSPPAGASPPLRQSLRGRLSKFRGVRRGASMSGATHCPSFTNLVDDEDIDDEDVDSLPSILPFHNSSSDDGEEELLLRRKKKRRQLATICAAFGMYYYTTYLDKAKYRIPSQTSYEWVVSTLQNRTSFYNMFRMNRDVFDSLHNILVQSYGLKSTRRMTSVEALAMFLWICGAPQSMSQAEDRFVRSTETCSRKFEKVLHSLCKLAGDIVKPVDPTFSTVHRRLQSPRFSPYFDNCIGAIDGTHVPVIVPVDKVVQHTGRHGYTSQNVLAICDFDMRFTFVVAGWPGSVHDMRVFKDALIKYGDKFPHPPEGKFYLVDSGYPNRPGYLAPYKGTKYHIPEFRQGPLPRGKKELFNYAHSSLRNVIERSFGVLKNKWRILRDLPAYPMPKQSNIIIACMAIHNFIRESTLADVDFERADNDESYVAPADASSSQNNADTSQHGDEDQDMNQFRDWIADGLSSRS
ncbi:uncharacterized protein [Setaria viridis]